LTTGTLPEVQAYIAGRPQFLSGYRDYLDRFGERMANELKLESATLHDDPLPLLRAVGALAWQLTRHGHGAPATPSGDRLRATAQARVRVAFARRPVRRVIFKWILRHARRRVRDRENLRFERTRLFGRVRRIFVELGRRLHADGVLDDPRDVFYLDVDEVLAFVEGRSTCPQLSALADARKREFETYRQVTAPDDRFETRGAVYRGHDFRSTAPREVTSGTELRGVGCSPGTVRGRVLIVKDPASVDLTERAILVAQHTDPGWIMIFPSALGVLVERGSLLSHAAIVARELGIPAIVSVQGLTESLQDGDVVEMDGATGVIRRVEPASADGARCA
jgi:pyruvate,water dikinase